MVVIWILISVSLFFQFSDEYFCYNAISLFSEYLFDKNYYFNDCIILSLHHTNSLCSVMLGLKHNLYANNSLIYTHACQQGILRPDSAT